jgi:hypothetical protein
MTEKVKSTKIEKKKLNYYKIITFILVGIILLVLLGFGATSVLSSAYNDGVVFGQQNTVNILLTEVNDKGYIEINLGENKTLALVPSSMIKNAQEDLVNGILNSVNEKGYVQINNGNNNSVVLVPYQEK